MARWVCSRPVNFAERGPSLDRDLAVGLGRQRQDHLGGVDVGLDLGQPFRRPLVRDDAIQALEEVDLVLGVPGHALAAVAKLRHERAQRREALVEVGIVALDHRDRRHGLAGDRLAFAALPVLDVDGLRDLGRRVVQDGCEDHVLLDAQHLGRDLGELLGDGLVDLPVARASHTGSTAPVSGWMKGCMSEVLRSFFSYQVAVGSTMSE